MKVKITTDRIPHFAEGSVHDVADERAAMLISRGFAEAVEEAPKRRGRPKKDAADV